MADAIFVVGQNPGTNHPRMLGDLRRAAERGARIVVFNPIRERGLERFADPQNKLEMLHGGSEAIASDYFQPRLGGDLAAFRGMAKAVLQQTMQRSPQASRRSSTGNFLTNIRQSSKPIGRLSMRRPGRKSRTSRDFSDSRWSVRRRSIWNRSGSSALGRWA